jgi:hypothetical protein
MNEGLSASSSSVIVMSDETAKKLAEAEAHASQLRAKADEQIQDCLRNVASGIPARLDDIARRTAQSQPEAAKSLGSDGLRLLREELTQAAQALASEVEGAATQIKWPEAMSEYSKVNVRDVHSAFFEFLYGARVDRLAAIFKRHGFSTGETGVGRSQSFVLPQYLYEEKAFGPVAEALNSPATAERAVAAAKADDDKDIVTSLWEDSESGG